MAAFIVRIPTIVLSSSDNRPRRVEKSIKSTFLSRSLPHYARQQAKHCLVTMSTVSATSASEGETRSTKNEGKMTVGEFIENARDLGTVRFIVIGNGNNAILETIGRFDYNVSSFSIPGKGEYLTLASVDKTFECHLNTSRVVRITMATEKAKIGSHDLHVIRFLNCEEGEEKAGDRSHIILSVLLMYDPSQGPGHYLHGAVDAFKKLRDQFGDSISVAH